MQGRLCRVVTRAPSQGTALILVVLLAATALGVSAESAGAANADQYGGFTSIDAKATGRFRVERIDGTWWFVDPDGHAFFSSGVNAVNIAGDFTFALGRSPYLDGALGKYGSAEAWAAGTRKRLHSWGINTIGAFSLPNLFAGTMPYTVLLNFTDYAPRVPKENAFANDSDVRDFLGPWFRVAANSYARDAATRCANDPWCIGVFTDNEPVWGRAVRQSTSFLHAYLGNVPGSSSKIALQRFFERRYKQDVAEFNTVWGTRLPTFDALQQLQALPVNPASETAAQLADDHAFRDFVAKRYFEVTDAALRAVDDKLLNLGPRFDALQTPDDIYRIAGKYVDVVSINDYERPPQTGAQVQAGFGSEGFLFAENPWDDLDTVERMAKRPIMITEFSYRSRVPGGPQGNLSPGFPYLADQAARAESYVNYMDELFSRPFVVGAHWFQLMDQPAEGRADGQDSNWGLVDIDDRPWKPLVEAFATTNAALPQARLR